MKVPGPAPKKPQMPSKDVPPNQHALLRLMLAEHAVLNRECRTLAGRERLCPQSKM